MSLRRSLYTAVEAAGVVGRQLFGDATNPVPADWTHVTKVDPEPDKRLPLLFPAYLAATDAVSVGGSRGVTAADTAATFAALDPADTPAILEPSAAEHITPETRSAARLLALPEVLNGSDESLVGTLGEGVAGLHDEMVPGVLRDAVPSWARRLAPARLRRWAAKTVGDPLADVLVSWLVTRAVSEAYVVQNPDSAAAREANVAPEDVLSPAAARERALAAEHRLGSEIVYLEYSGTFGDEAATETLAALQEATQWARVWYGGGVRSAAAADAVLSAGADAVVVGDAFHDVADEEAELVARYLADRGVATPAALSAADAEPATIGAWLDESVDLAATAAAGYLSTQPTVDDHVGLARRYLTATVATWLWLASDRAAAAGDRADAVQSPWTTGAYDGVFAAGGEAFAETLRTAVATAADHDASPGDETTAESAEPASLARVAADPTDRATALAASLGVTAARSPFPAERSDDEAAPPRQ